MTSKKRKAQTQSQAQSQSRGSKATKVARPLSPPDDSKDGKTAYEPTSLQTVTSPEELEITVDTLKTLSSYPGLIKLKQCKELRTAVHDFRQACTTGVNAAGLNLTARITAALADGKYTEARVFLAEMRVRGEEPKLGALCRWVRDLDIISGLSTVADHGNQAARVVYERSAEDKDRLLVVDAILRGIGSIDVNPEALRLSASLSTSAPAIHVQEIWDLRPTTARDQVYASVLDRTILERAPANPNETLPVLETTPGAQRKPPNHHPAILYTSKPNAIRLSPIPPPTTYHAHPVVPRLGVATNVLSPDECKAIIAAGESVGFLPDAPVREDGDVSILAHNFYWVTDTAFHDMLWARISPHVPASIDGRIARGINRRFRVYRYVPGAEYRCHIDGAWPPSGIVADQNGDRKYVYDASPEDKKQSSLFTFLVYLNDEFEGGETTFFLPGAVEGILNAYPVRPVIGSVAIFPHGETHGALLHEGTGVREGAKYVIRTDVEYDIEATVSVDI
ncbi:prolyl 4-hydroxylase [Ophiostoma piceae UAMH 11346]|uniref:Prolyl 4-hydroxylase n=1 Tax=Ophiostoma piceae (strain UAMH 11346) TaxID=1262450 RepID=S3C0R8_OPHP1|nr:prolyl 4-hydroxylase [Ophiostoma piceae UAMH 11346]